ncbi:TAT-variant-translocated molybdopterin oxidoreductase [Cellulophaga tyrosinoxydans]|uniref:Prokaryotic molybdopterin-containing oxidoreductase family, iron-sulfur binding subunit n=1 Tax=Cellulophaga tyrosinoxydans TaxID=504486 RepID=A0A1W1YEF0_9FLAO|nr:TAT-variant-translocated molybdopterin oxidoreductase [Cellulophaga tyrosinoxydans]SMC34513.1 prokaryotic molybdopterin-containing oxidoreductase family, iron-sulfur binding subunit [Cellulophaga tyrosinoxydans]
MASNKKYWKSEAELNPNDSIVETLRHNEFVQDIPVDEFLGDKENLASSSTNRRDFLKYVGFSTAAATLAACEGPVVKSIPYVVQPESIIPGVANHYATTIANGFDFASVLVRTREGRPISIHNNTDAKINASANARVNASVLNLYDSTRLQGPTFNGESIEWSGLDAAVKKGLEAAKNSGKQIAVLTQTYASPSTARLVNEFKEVYGNVNHVVYDAISEDAALNAFQAKYGERALADYDFSKAEVIVSFGADFLGDWQGGGYDSGCSKGRVPQNGKMSKHFQFEANMSLTGANADKRVPLKPSQQKVALANLYAKLNNSSVGGELSDAVAKALESAVASIKKAGANAVVVTGLDDENAQAVVLAINEFLGSKAFDATAPKYTRQGNVKAVNALISEMKAGRVGAILMDGVNPMYSLPNAADFAEGLKNVGLSVSFSSNVNETSVVTQYVGAAPHYLESWGDVQMKKGNFALIQPAIKELFDTRQFQTSLLKWIGSDKTYYDYIKETWTANVLGSSDWNEALHDGFYAVSDAVVMESVPVVAAASVIETEEVVATTEIPLASALRSLASADTSGMELVLYSKTGMGDGQMANNPWLQEFPDPITRVSWDNYLTVSKADAEKLGFVNENVANGGLDGSYAKVTVNGVSVSNVPVIIQPGQAVGSIGLSFGYGKKEGLKSEMQTGVNAYPLYQDFSATQNVSIEKVAGNHEFACVQLHKTLMGRGDIIKETTLEIFNTKDAAEWNIQPMVSLDHQEVLATSVDLWDSFDRSIGHHFNLSIDLNACTGCGACVIACHAENNVPVVGKEEVRKSRDMHWLRIDRYYSSEDTFEQDNIKKDEFDGLTGDKGSLSGFGELEDPAVNPQVAFQPVMCQHCNHAPCETVCPVAATSHGRQGQNHMAYNRCVGTRYCANNCPYKVRRFNWFLYNNNDEFDYHMNNDLGKMVINPDVTVRSRGVMEKCSMCIQKTQKTILDAKRDGRVVKDGEFQTACSAACSSGAMVFGDVNDGDSKIAELKESSRMYHLLEHVGTKPNVFYHVKVRNTEEV